MLTALSGQVHEVETAICLSYQGKLFQASALTRVLFRQLSSVEIAEYVALGTCYDKAGAYGIQDSGIGFVEAVYGDYTNVVGLPIFTLQQLLHSLQIPLSSLIAPTSHPDAGAQEYTPC
jgi:septum formation protein